MKQLRTEAGVTQSALSDALGMPQSFVSKYEMGERRLDFVEVAHICQQLGKPLVDFAADFTREVTNRDGRSRTAAIKGGRDA